jgi:hypothetical protein
VLCGDCDHPRSRGVPGSALRGKFGANGARGVEGEEVLGDLLDEGMPGCFEVLHSLNKLDSEGDIDHVVVAATGVWVIDAKHWRDQLEIRPAMAHCAS